MKPKDEITEERIPMFVESQRGDDRIGTDPGGSLITDHVATENGVPFESGVPQNKIQEAVETQLKDDKWVVVEKKGGSTELLTKKDMPKPKDGKEGADSEGMNEERDGVDKVHTEGSEEGDDPEAPEKVGANDWKASFGTPPGPKEAAAQVIKSSACAAQPKEQKKPVEKWESKFKDVKSATATHKGKGG